MDFFRALFGEKIENENKTKAFHQNKTNEERTDWFLRTRPWHNVDQRIIHALVEKFGDNQMSEVFMFASMNLNLVDRYRKLSVQDIDGNQLICSMIAQMLCKEGLRCEQYILSLLKNVSKNKSQIDKLYNLAIDAFDSAVILDEQQMAAYQGLATVYALFNKPESALIAAKKGLNSINQLRENGGDIVLKRINPAYWETLQEMEKNFNLIVKNLS